MIEAELKARVRDPEEVARRLGQYGTSRVERYWDTYYDDDGRTLSGRDQELRVRTVENARGKRSVLTFKGAVIDAESGSKPEHESEIAEVEALHAILRGLGYRPFIAFEKRCRNYEFEARGRRMLATLVRVPEIEGDYLEVETLVESSDDLPAALAGIREVLAELGIGEAELTRELYTEAVAASRWTNERSARSEAGQVPT
ncbi:class IV adenylate cyclase [Streptomyces millisiae]|uniref:Class IV adenylate cyclase n=1 Tax=Streptomyces millisiae TaxID=3075542 RepID=A0ABU2LS54_9ACTN|nr:class IV adenylate cyclase [Streptomyces sp. DSM 44918]MDT0320088.1 class IV adenylate cyclase [Streptomyces sp. DSM 44918]